MLERISYCTIRVRGTTVDHIDCRFLPFLLLVHSVLEQKFFSRPQVDGIVHQLQTRKLYFKEKHQLHVMYRYIVIWMKTN